jgi:type I restriction-modification system DNA methylase subunit
MDKQQATALISNTFEHAFDEAQYLRFLRELFNGQIDESDDRKFDLYGQYIPDSFKDAVRRYKRLGTYTDPNGHEIDLLVVILKRESSLDRARTMQRNFAAYHLKRREKETAVIAYTTEDRNDWRFSMVRREPIVTFSEAGNLISKDDLTPVRRYSFLVGQNERSHTAQQQLLPILVDDKNDPTLDRLEDAFNIETVTKEFFERYKNLFLQLKEELDRLTAQNPGVQAEFSQKGLETANFAKKLLGQIVFLYFLQKKGWLGVSLDATWGTGSKSFLRELFNQVDSYNNFFNDVLEPLFYEALAIERPDNIYPRLNAKIPFLNGGLFEPVGNYDWRSVDILIDNSVFESIFTTFDLYNFTVREDEPLEKEVAVDPEMLGKVFENLLEVTDRKSKGAFYTPREIVHYMCQESLINYLDTKLNSGSEPLIPPQARQQSFVDDPEPEQLSLTVAPATPVIPRDDIASFIRVGEFAVQNDTAKEAGTVSYKYRMPETIRSNAAKLDEALASIKICDPAIGSGAFPVGMMQEIIKAREVLTTYLGSSDERTTYHFKRQAIQESIYGVDIDPGAIDIAKLRLWLSLVVDEDDYQDIKPLPNLDYKIMCGNSLLQTGHDLFNDHLYVTLEKLKNEYFSTAQPEKKTELRERISSQIRTIFAEDEVNFDIRVYFSEIFHGKNQGFDIVIGNPPYLNVELIPEADKKYYGKVYGTFYKRSDIFGIFFELGLKRLTTDAGNVTFIIPSQILNNDSYKKLRDLFLNNKWLREVVYLGDKIFQEANNDVCILFLDKTRPKNIRIIDALDYDQWVTTEVASDYFSIFDNYMSIDDPAEASIYANIFDKKNVRTDMNFDVFQGVIAGDNDVYAFETSASAQEHRIEKGLLKTLVLGRDFERWYIHNQSRRLLYIDSNTSMSDYPYAKSWLDKNNQGHYQLHRSREQWKLDAIPKILVQGTRNQRLKTRVVATIDHIGVYGLQSVNFIIPRKGKNEFSLYYLLAILNSSTINFLYQTKYLNVAIKASYLKKTPFPKATRQEQEALVQKVKAIFALTEFDDYPTSKDKKYDVPQKSDSKIAGLSVDRETL